MTLLPVIQPSAVRRKKKLNDFLFEFPEGN
jgi:hypothetical protein